MMISRAKREAVAAEFAAHMIDAELKDLAKNRPDRLAEVTEEMKTDATLRHRDRAEKLIDRLGSIDESYLMLRNGTFHPSNKSFRRIFESATGIKLPSGAGATKAAIRAWIGEDFVAAKDAEHAAAKEAKELARAEASRAAHESAMNRLVEKFPEGLSGDELLDLARHFGLDVHPRTAGLLRRRVVWIGNDTARIRGKGGSGDAFVVHRAVAERISAARLAAAS